MFRCGSTVESPGVRIHRTRILWRLVGIAAMLLGGAPKAHSAPVRGEVFSHRQPDGAYVDVRIWGDEFYRVVESLDGYTLTLDPKTGAASYAHLSSDGNELISTGVRAAAVFPGEVDLDKHIRINQASSRAKIDAARARHAQREAEVRGGLRTPAAPPDSGDVVGIVILVDFEDDVWTIPPANVDNYCNQIGYTGYGNNGSVRDYFYEVSDGHLTYTNYVPSSYYRAVHPKTWYEDPGFDRAQGLVLEALNDLEANGFDFSGYDSNGDDLIDGINVFYAGWCRNAWSEGLWPHSSSITFDADGVSAFRYQMTNMGDVLRLGTFCHENGHMIGYWPDLYDYDHDSAGVGAFCLMCHGGFGTNPVHPCAYLKAIAGWSTMTFLGSTPQPGLVVPITNNTMFRYINPSYTSEYYLIENRQQIGRDAWIPDAGLAIWHVDTMGNNSWQDMTPARHYKVTLVQADGDWDLEFDRNGGDTTDLYGAPEYTECSPVTNPATTWWDGMLSDMRIANISVSGPTMTFDFDELVYVDCNNNEINDVQDIFDETSLDCQPNSIPDECELRDCAGDVACLDCNGNTVPDECDLATAADCDADGVPDECAGGGVLIDTDFESGLPDGWTVSGMFGVTGECAAAEPVCSTGSNWAYAGYTSDCRYRVDETVELRAPTVTLGHGVSELQFCSRVDVEPEWDFVRVIINSTVVWEQSVDDDVWLQEVIDLSNYNGQTVDIVFQLYSDEYNAFDLGWQLDNVYLSSGTRDCDDDSVPDECQTDIDCNENGTYDGCDIADTTSPDCNANSTPDECDVDPTDPDGDGEVSLDDNGNSVPDECDAVAPALPSSPHDARKNRYISIDPTPSEDSVVAIAVELVSMKRCSEDERRACIVDGDCPGVCSLNHDLQCEDDGICAAAGPCVQSAPCVEHGNVGTVTRYVNVPVTSSCVPLNDCAGQWFADLEKVKENAVYRVWTEGLVHITDCAIVPVATYALRSTMDGTYFSDPLIIGTCDKPNVHYGDCVGPVVGGQYSPPDGFTNVSDVQAYLLANQGGATAPHTTWVDLHGALIGSACIGADCIVPQQILNVGDLQTIKFGFLGSTYIETPGQENPADCP